MLLAPLLMLLEVVGDLLLPMLMADIIDRGVVAGDKMFVLERGGLMLAVVVMAMCGGLGCVFFSSIASQNFGADLRYDVFRKVQTFSFTNLDRFPTATLVTRLTSDIVQLQNVVLSMLRILVRAPLLCIGGIIMAIVLNPQLSLILLVVIPVIIAIMGIVMGKGFRLYGLAQRQLDKINSVMRENLAGVRLVKAFAREEYEMDRFAVPNDEMTRVSVQANRIIGSSMPILMLIMNLSIVAVIWLGGVRVNLGGMQTGEVIAYANYMTQILFSLIMVAFMLAYISRGKVSAERITEVLDTEADIAPAADAGAPADREGRVEFHDVSFRYNDSGDAMVLDSVSFTAWPGETVAILGGTGSGKSTLVSLIPRFYDIEKGQVRVDGMDVRSWSLDKLRGEIGFVLQESVLFSGSIIDNIRWGAENASMDDIQAAARVAQVEDFIDELPEKYETELGQRGVNLSGGQKQRIAIARTLLKKPRILILDDSTSALDLATEARLRKNLRKYMEKSTIFIIAQRISSVINADRIIVLEDGRIAGNGRHGELLEACPVYRDIYDSQRMQEGEEPEDE